MPDDTRVNFLPKAISIPWQGTEIAVLLLRKIIKSKEFIRRPKDIAHLPLLRQTLRMKRADPL